ncbi:CxC2 domain-containing protein [Mycena kentingensis (nom. inval.)]|nr:CxC2 domain-containing protein [Mycena kentingensis (nom. inval.)]
MEEVGWEDVPEDVVHVQIEAPPPRRRYVSSDDPMRLWRGKIPSYLNELLRLEGLGRHHERPRADSSYSAKAVCDAGTSASHYIDHTYVLTGKPRLVVLILGKQGGAQQIPSPSLSLQRQHKFRSGRTVSYHGDYSNRPSVRRLHPEAGDVFASWSPMEEVGWEDVPEDVVHVQIEAPPRRGGDMTTLCGYGAAKYHRTSTSFYASRVWGGITRGLGAQSASRKTSSSSAVASADSSYSAKAVCDAGTSASHYIDHTYVLTGKPRLVVLILGKQGGAQQIPSPSLSLQRQHKFRSGRTVSYHGDYSVHFTSKGRGTKTRLVNVEPSKRARLHPEAGDVFASWSPMEEVGWEDVPEDVVHVQIEAPPPRRRYVSSVSALGCLAWVPLTRSRRDDPMRLWRGKIPSYLNELLRLEGLGRHHERPRCAECQQEDVKLFRCRQCGLFLQCESCLRRRHERQPLHRPHVWNGDYWAPCSLFRDDAADVSLGMVYQLGHHGFSCPLPARRGGKDRPWTLTVMDLHGIFQVDVRYCACTDARRHRHGFQSQLMDNGWYPATTIEPATCATFTLLDHFRRLKVFANANAHDFVRCLERSTDATLTKKVPDRYKSFMRMSRQWDFLKRCKRAGRGNEPNGVQTTPPGGLAVRCWACPDPERNMPEGWDKVPEHEAFRHALILALDANFRLKNRIRANERQDPSLGPGLGYFVLSDAYKYFLRHYVAEEDVSTCIAFQALMQKETRLTTGLRVSGVGGCVCARHGVVRPLGLGDLQKGERYANMDWILLSAVGGTRVMRLVLSYDIACQWKQRLAIRAKALLKREEERLEEVVDGSERAASAAVNDANIADAATDKAVPERVGAIRTNLEDYQIQFALPVWHAAAHERSCQAANSLSHAVGVGRTDGEGIERTWAVVNPIAYSTKEMGEGARHDTIEDKIDNINFLKNANVGQRTDWQRRLDKWNADPTAPNPYMAEGKHAGATEAQIVAELKKAELEEVRAGRVDALVGKMTAVAFVKAGLQLEDLQRRIRSEVAATVTMTAERASQLDELRASFFKKLRKWETQQATFMPGVEDLRMAEEEGRDADAAPVPAEQTRLWLPSDLTDEQRRRAGRTALARIELRLREGQCGDAVSRLRGVLQARHHFIDHRNATVVGQAASTRSNNVITRLDGQSRRQGDKYRAARQAGLTLDASFCPQFLELSDDDMRVGVEVESDASARAALNKVGASRRVRNEPTVPKPGGIKPLSWIWSVGGSADLGELHDAVRVQWTKAKARRDRWIEEVELIREEMRRVLRSLETVQAEWREREKGRDGADKELAAGARAYAKRQAAIYGKMSVSFRSRWSSSAADSVRRVVSNRRDVDSEAEEVDDAEDLEPDEEMDDAWEDMDVEPTAAGR